MGEKDNKQRIDEKLGMQSDTLAAIVDETVINKIAPCYGNQSRSGCRCFECWRAAPSKMATNTLNWKVMQRHGPFECAIKDTLAL